VDADTTGGGINGGVGGGEGYAGRGLIYVGVPDVEAALRRAESLGGKRRMGPEGAPGTLVVRRVLSPELVAIATSSTDKTREGTAAAGNDRLEPSG
jgi:uncharacterized protein